MILIADSGSTKTEWRVIDGDGKISQIKTDGVNPYYMTEAAISDVFSLGLKKYIDLPIEKIYFYGAGCTSDSNKQKITRCLK